MYCHWATMSLDHHDLLVVPFRPLPSELGPNHDLRTVNEERRYIRDHILNRTKQELVSDPKARALMHNLGSDLVVNAYACNFRVDGKVNTDVCEANRLNSRISKKLSFHRMSDNLHDQKIILMSTTFSQKDYGACLTRFKERLGLSGQSDLVVLVNVSMSPFGSPYPGYERMLAEAFLQVAEDEAKVSIRRQVENCHVLTRILGIHFSKPKTASTPGFPPSRNHHAIPCPLAVLQLR